MIKKNNYLVLLLFLLVGFFCDMNAQKFEPTVASMQQYQTPEWFKEAKFGIWTCWNAYTVPAVGDWYARRMYEEGHPHYNYHLKNYGHPSEFGYKDIVHLWKGEKFNAQELVDLFVETGAKYIVGMANHHDNFDLWDSKHHEWNSVNYGPKRDIMREMQNAVRKYEDQGIRWGITSHLERTWSWFQTNKGADKSGPYAGVPYDGNDPNYQDFYLPPDPNGDTKPTQPTNAPLRWRKEWLARCKDLIENYDPDMFYVDGGVPFPGDDKGKTGLEMISYLYNQSMERHNGKNEAVMCIKDWTKRMPNGEWGYYWDDIATLDLERTRLPKIRKESWQTDTSIGPWTYVKGANYRSATDIIHELIDIVSKNGNMLLNVSPKADGTLDDNAYKLLKEIGAWMKVNSESIYGTQHWEIPGNTTQRIVKKGNNNLYLSVLEAPKDNTIVVPYLAPKKGTSLGITSISILGSKDKLTWESTNKGLFIKIPDNLKFKHAIVFKIEGDSFGDYNEALLSEVNNRSSELKVWWKTQRVTKVSKGYKKVAADGKNQTWAINAENHVVLLKDGKELPVGNLKARDIGASPSGVICVTTTGEVYINKHWKIWWIELLKSEKTSYTSPDGSPWVKIPGIKAKRCDLGRSGGVWVITEDNKVAYYATNKWNVLEKEAEDIGCGWPMQIAIIANGQLEKFEGTKWENLGGNNLKSVDISVRNDVLVTLDKEGKIAAHDGLGWYSVRNEESFIDVSCGLKNDDETIALIK